MRVVPESVETYSSAADAKNAPTGVHWMIEPRMPPVEAMLPVPSSARKAVYPRLGRGMPPESTEVLLKRTAMTESVLVREATATS